MTYKKLYKVTRGRMVLGVCGGIAEYFNVDPSLVRVGACLLGLTGTGVLAYIVAAVILPSKEEI